MHHIQTNKSWRETTGGKQGGLWGRIEGGKSRCARDAGRAARRRRRPCRQRGLAGGRPARRPALRTAVRGDRSRGGRAGRGGWAAAAGVPPPPPPPQRAEGKGVGGVGVSRAGGGEGGRGGATRIILARGVHAVRVVAVGAARRRRPRRGAAGGGGGRLCTPAETPHAWRAGPPRSGRDWRGGRAARVRLCDAAAGGDVRACPARHSFWSRARTAAGFFFFPFLLPPPPTLASCVGYSLLSTEAMPRTVGEQAPRLGSVGGRARPARRRALRVWDGRPRSPPAAPTRGQSGRDGRPPAVVAVGCGVGAQPVGIMGLRSAEPAREGK